MPNKIAQDQRHLKATKSKDRWRQAPEEMYKSLLRTVPLQVRSQIIKLSTTKGTNGKRKQKTEEMETRYDFNRRWKPLQNYKALCCTHKQSTFKLVSYNILAQDLLLEHLFLYVGIPQEFLTWRRRQQNILQELIKLDSDILCLQEMQYDHLALLVQGLRMGNSKRLAYVFKKKTGHRTDGCAIVYDSCKFELLDHRAVELHDKEVALLNRENVALFAKFRFKKEQVQQKDFVVATTHLLYNPNRSDVRCAQVGRILEELQTFSTDTPIVLTGDFNSMPNSSPIDLLIGQREGEETKGNQAPLRFELIDPGENTASTYQDEWITVDYILRSLGSRSRHKLLPISVYSLPSISRCSRIGQIPNHYLGSDHYAMGAIFTVV
ncbi:protein angel [Drosophila ficusphila]|uniref:protein angel n=1 Tax=Drosophila ficusphila TaxID=30025 RepID=UPI0007E5C7F8|nr:protein angel [Drosophila ficusphila]